MDFCRFLRSVKFGLKSGLSVDFLGVMCACGYSGVRVAVFFEKLAHFLAFVVEAGVVTTEASQSERMEWHFLRVVDERTTVANSCENQLVCIVH